MLWHVKNLKLSCKNRWESAKLMLYLTKIYGSCSKMMIQRRKTFEYLGMDVDFSEKGVFAVSMILFIDKIEANFWEAITKSSATPHNQHLFKVKDDQDAQFLQEEHAQQFHHIVAKFVILQERHIGISKWPFHSPHQE